MEKGTAAIDTVHLAGLIQNYVTSVCWGRAVERVLDRQPKCSYGFLREDAEQVATAT